MPLFNQTKNFILSQTPQISGLFAQASKQTKKNSKVFSSASELEKQLPKKGGVSLICDLTQSDSILFDNFLNLFNQNENKIQTCIILLSDEHSGENQAFFDKVLNSGSFDLIFNGDDLSLNDFEKIVTQSESVQQEEADVKIQFPVYYKNKEKDNEAEQGDKATKVEVEKNNEVSVSHVENNVLERPVHEYEAIIDEKNQQIVQLQTYSKEQEAFMDNAESEIKSLKAQLEEKNKNEDHLLLEKERDSLLQEVAKLKNELSENSVYEESVKELKLKVNTLQQEKNSFKQRAEKAEAMCNMDSSEASIVEIVSTMRHLSDILTKSGQRLDNKAGKEVKQLKKQVTQLETEKEATDQIKDNLRKLLV